MTVRQGQAEQAAAAEVDLSRMIGHLLRAVQQVHVAIWSDLFPAGLTSAQFAVLNVLARDGQLTQTALRSRARLDRSTAADVIRRLVARRLLSQVKDPDDARRRVVRLTNAGRALYAEAAQRALQVNDAMLQGLDDGQRATLLDLLNVLLTQHRGLLDYQDE